MYRAIWTTPIPAPRSQQSVSQRSTYRTLGSDELRQRMNSHWDQGRLLVSCDLATFETTRMGSLLGTFIHNKKNK